ncbi:MAG: sugar ABC transporter ATP-binding protein [bacterium]|nr:sugar ABC transporter ATP-binding protein [bacterium]
MSEPAPKEKVATSGSAVGSAIDPPVLRLEDITKSFGTNKVLKGVSMELHAGRITALLGANGAGKSTLIKILAGIHELDSGQILVAGGPVVIATPAEAQNYGIQTVHQRIDETIVPGLSVAENLCFEEIVRGDLSPFASVRSMLPRAREIASALGLGWSDAKLKQDVYELGIADSQLLLLARALVRQPKVLVLDEPTSTLSDAEVDRLFEVVRRLRDSGVAILYVSHHLSEILQLADELVVLRDGRITDVQAQPFDLNHAVQSMLGREVLTDRSEDDLMHGEKVALELRGVQLLKRSTPFDLDLRYGEVTGIVGLIGAGKSELARAIFGRDPYFAGTMTLDGAPYAPRSTADAVKKGIYLVPEDRAAEAMLPGWNVARTVVLPFVDDVSSAGVVSSRSEMGRGERVIEDFSVVAQGPSQTVDALSGGNQQKVVVGRWFTGEPRVMLLDEPFRGVDIGARVEISHKIRELAASGACAVVCASDVDEIRGVADRVVVLVEGNVTKDAYMSELDHNAIVASMTEVA